MAGLGGVCSHVSAVLFKILEANKMGITVKSCTDRPMSWNSSTRRYVRPEKIRNIKKKKHYRVHNNTSVSPTKKFPQYYDDEHMKESALRSPLGPLMMMNSTLWSEILSSSESSEIPVEKAQPIHVCKEIGYSPTLVPAHEIRVPCTSCNEFYETYVKLSPEQKSTLCVATTGQSSSDMWKDSRKIRLTGSTSTKCPKRQDTNPDEFLKFHVHSTFKGNADTQHGLANEGRAISEFENITSFKVVRCGTVVAKNDSWLSASPDGLIEEDSILEVKCPTKNIDELLSGGQYDVRTNDSAGNYLHKTGKNGYYMQVQLTMYCTNRNNCFFFVWGVPKCVLINVKYDFEFVSTELTRLRKFYFLKMLPFLCEDKEKGKLMFGRKYLKLVEASG